MFNKINFKPLNNKQGKLYKESPMFNQSVRQLRNGVNPIDILYDVCIAFEELNKMYIDEVRGSKEPESSVISPGFHPRTKNVPLFKNPPPSPEFPAGKK